MNPLLMIHITSNGHPLKTRNGRPMDVRNAKLWMPSDRPLDVHGTSTGRSEPPWQTSIRRPLEVFVLCGKEHNLQFTEEGENDVFVE